MTDNLADLRKRAENRVVKNKTDILSLSNVEIKAIIHDLEVHQVELEMQNDELKIAQRKLENLKNKYSKLYEFAPVGYLTINKKLEIIQANKTIIKLLGSKDYQFIGKQFTDFIDKTYQDNFYLFNNKLKSKTVQSCKLLLTTSDKFCFYAQLDVYMDEAEDIKITVTDINELVQAKEKAEESDRLKTAFLSNMSHEIRTPMNGILGFADLLKNSNLTNEKQQKYISIIEKGGVRMLNIINDIINISKIESGAMEVIIGESDINQQIEYIYNFFKPEIERKGIQFSISNSLPPRGVVIKTDREKVYAILTNLVKNAIKFTEEGSIEVGVSKRNNLVEFYVRDTGIGIPKTKQKLVFERFMQGDIVNKMARQGAGLGLSISKAYVELLGGRIWVESSEKEGTTFYFTIPDYSETKEKNNFEIESLPEVDKIRTKELNILIVEDDKVSEELLSIHVQKFGKKIINVKSGKEAVAACRENPDLDLVLMDIKLPELDGYEASRQIREFNKDIIIIAQTALGLAEDKVKAIAAGCNDYIAKPIKHDELSNMIVKYLKLRDYEDA